MIKLCEVYENAVSLTGGLIFFMRDETIKGVFIFE